MRRTCNGVPGAVFEDMVKLTALIGWTLAAALLATGAQATEKKAPATSAKTSAKPAAKAAKLRGEQDDADAKPGKASKPSEKAPAKGRADKNAKGDKESSKDAKSDKAVKTSEKAGAKGKSDDKAKDAKPLGAKAPASKTAAGKTEPKPATVKAAAPDAPPPPKPEPPRPAVPVSTYGGLYGLGEQETRARLGAPDVAREEGAGAMWTYRQRDCALMVFFRSDNGGPMKVSGATSGPRRRGDTPASLEACVAEARR